MMHSYIQAMVEAEAEAAQDFEEGYINDSDPSVLRFLIASRWGELILCRTD